MLLCENTVISDFDAAIRGMRNALNSWDKADSESGFGKQEDVEDKLNNFINGILIKELGPDAVFVWEDKVEDRYCELAKWYLENCKLEKKDDVWSYFFLGQNDLKLAKKLSAAGPDHGKFLRQIRVSVDITAPLYWYKEFDTYKVGTVANSTSTMHKLASTPITMDCFSFDGMLKDVSDPDWVTDLYTLIFLCETTRRKYIATGNKAYWRRLVQILPNAWNQKRTITLNYAVLKAMYHARKNHKLNEWHTLCAWIEQLPYAHELLEIDKNEVEE